ncbi:MAG: AAA family ATPase [Thermoleophilia bacterium]
MTGNEKPRTAGGASRNSDGKSLSRHAGEVPPFNLEAEQSLLGAMLITPALLPQVTEQINAEDFFLDSERIIFKAILELDNPDPVTLKDHLRSKGELDRVGGPDYIHTLIKLCPVASNAAQYAEIVKQYSIRRAVIAEAKAKINAAAAGEDLPELRQPIMKQTGYTMAQLMSMDFPDPAWLVEDLLPEVGLTVLAGSPKVGKSWFVLDLATRLSGAGAKTFLNCSIPGSGRVLYLALEDNWRRLKSRGDRMLQGGTAPDRLHLEIGWPRLDDGGEDRLSRWLQKNPDTKLVIVDVFVRIRQKSRGGNIYDEDYSALGPLKTLADEFEIAVLAVHHTNQRQGLDNWLELVSGSNGLTGIADAVMLLSKGGEGRADGRLRCTGRDLAELDFALSFDNFLWTRLDGDAEDHMRSVPRQRIIECLRKSNEALGPKAVAEKTGQDHEAVKKLMPKMAEQGELKKEDYGKYTVPFTPAPSTPSDPSGGENEDLKGGKGNGGSGGSSLSGVPLPEPEQAALEEVIEL